MWNLNVTALRYRFKCVNKRQFSWCFLKHLQVGLRALVKKMFSCSNSYQDYVANWLLHQLVADGLIVFCTVCVFCWGNSASILFYNPMYILVQFNKTFWYLTCCLVMIYSTSFGIALRGSVKWCQKVICQAFTFMMDLSGIHFHYGFVRHSLSLWICQAFTFMMDNQITGMHICVFHIEEVFIMSPI